MQLVSLHMACAGQGLHRWLPRDHFRAGPIFSSYSTHSVVAGGALVSRAATDPQETGLDRYLRAAADKVGCQLLDDLRSARHVKLICLNASAACLQFENAQNKPAVAGWAVGAVFALFFAEWLIHKPVLSIVSGLCW